MFFRILPAQDARSLPINLIFRIFLVFILFRENRFFSRLTPSDVN